MVAALLLVATPVSAAVTRGTPNSTTGSGATSSMSVTTTATERSVVCSVTRDASATVQTLTYAGQAMSLRGTTTPSDGFGRVEMWVIVNATLGANTIALTLSQGTNHLLACVPYSGASQLLTDYTFTAATPATNASPSVTVTSAAGEFVQDALGVSIEGSETAVVGGGQTQVANQTFTSQIIAGASTEPGATSVVMSWILGESDEWAIAAIRIRQAGPPDTEPPSAPENLAGSAVSSSRLSWGWTASTDNVGVVNYSLECCSGSGCSPTTEVAAPTTTNTIVTGLTAATLHRCRVRAHDGTQFGGYSSIAEATTLATRHVNLRWTDTNSAPNETGTEVWYCEGTDCDPTTGTLLTTVAADVITASHSASPTPVAGYAVRAMSPASAFSNIWYSAPGGTKESLRVRVH
jgi:hypothetical protein